MPSKQCPNQMVGINDSLILFQPSFHEPFLAIARVLAMTDITRRKLSSQEQAYIWKIMKKAPDFKGGGFFLRREGLCILQCSRFILKLVSGLQWLNPSYRKPYPRGDCSLAECAMCLRARHNHRENRLLVNLLELTQILGLLESRPGYRLATRLASTVRECVARTSFRALPVEQGLLADASWHRQMLEGSKGSSAPPVFTPASVQSWD